MFLQKAVDVCTGKNSATLGISPTTNKAQRSMANVTIKTRFPYLHLHKITHRAAVEKLAADQHAKAEHERWLALKVLAITIILITRRCPTLPNTKPNQKERLEREIAKFSCKYLDSIVDYQLDIINGSILIPQMTRKNWKNDLTNEIPRPTRVLTHIVLFIEKNDRVSHHLLHMTPRWLDIVLRAFFTLLGESIYLFYSRHIATSI
ncbi:unnamed protein product [Rhizophagus irregularis]|nr:unnamed protein product [Rhizophagus irregularis]